jgi:hypothetical protein
MNDRRCFETLDRTLRDICEEPDTIFGKKNVMLGGDFKQMLPVKKNVSTNEIVASFISESYLWQHLKVFFLKQNMRLQQPNMSQSEKEDALQFSKWLLDVGDGKIGTPDTEDPRYTSWVRIPDTHCFPAIEEGKWSLINFIYDNHTLHRPTPKAFQDKAIVCPKNETADSINTDILRTIKVTSQFYTSNDQVIPRSNDGGASEILYPVEYLNSISISGFPPHKL